MTKSELLSTYTAEQLAEMVVKKEEENQKLYDEAKKWQKEAEQRRKVYQSICHLENLEGESVRLQSEVNHYRKAFEDAKKERDCQIAEYQKKIEELTTESEKLKGNVSSKGCCEKQEKTNNLYGIYAHSAKDLTKDDLLMFLGILTKELIDNGIDFRYEMEKELKVWDIKIKRDNDIADLLPTEPIKVADMLINAEGKRNENSLTRIFGETYHIFDISELRQIAEHLLVYCNHNGDVEE